MEMKTFNEITKEIFVAYGFKKNGKNYILQLEYIANIKFYKLFAGENTFFYL